MHYRDPNISRIKNFLLMVFLLVVTRLFDIITTFLYIPDLKGEVNPIVSVFNLGWISLLIVQVLVVVMLIYSLYVYYFKNVVVNDVKESITLKQFISLFHFGNPNKFSMLFYKLPRTKYSLFYSIGAIIPKGLIIISAIVGISTGTLIENERYRSVYKTYNFPLLLICLSVLIMLVLTIRFYKIEKRRRINIL